MIPDAVLSRFRARRRRCWARCRWSPIGLGELLGARPVQVLFGSAQGNACLAVGGAGYALGLLWMSSMMRNTGTNVDTV